MWLESPGGALCVSLCSPGWEAYYNRLVGCCPSVPKLCSLAGHGIVPTAAFCAVGATALVLGPQSDVNLVRHPGMEDVQRLLFGMPGYPPIDDLEPPSSIGTRAQQHPASMRTAPLAAYLRVGPPCGGK